MTPKPWIVHHRDGWCALPPGAEPDPEAFNDPTLCGHVVTMRGGSKRGTPDCPECLALLKAQAAVEQRKCPRCGTPKLNRCRAEDLTIMEHPHPERVKIVTFPAQMTTATAGEETGR